jgi:hypothetical protein
MKKPDLTFIALVQIFIYISLWLINDYTATLFSGIMFFVSLFILVLSLIVELIERSKVDKWYFYLILLSCIIPLVIGIIMTVIKKGDLDWMHGIG